MMDDAESHPSVLPGYDGGPYTHRPDLLGEPMFWLAHLYSCVQSEQAEELFFGADYEAAVRVYSSIHEAADWPVFTLPVASGHRIHVVYRTSQDDPGTDYLLHHPDWERAEVLAQDEGHFMGAASSGRCGLNYWEPFGETELGWTFKAEVWGHGYATEAARACLEWGFATLDAQYFTSMIQPANTPSIRVAERLGFTRLRDDVLLRKPVTAYSLNRPATEAGV